MTPSLTLAAVAYSPGVPDLWSRLVARLGRGRIHATTVFFPDYPTQVAALRTGAVDLAWNSEVAHVQAQAEGSRAVVQRDIDVERTARIVALQGGNVATIADLRGGTLALGNPDCAHASIMPLHFLAGEGLREGENLQVLRLLSDPGLHGHAGRSDTDVAKAVLGGRAGAGAVGARFWDRLAAERLVPRGALEVVWTSPSFPGSVLDARPGLDDAVTQGVAEALLGLAWEDDEDRKLLDALECRTWVRADEARYDGVRAAVAASVPLKVTA